MTEIDTTDGAVLEALNDKSDRDLQNTLGGGVLDYVVEAQTFEDGSWYRKYKSGWIEQGGHNVKGNTTLTFNLPFANTNYVLTVYCASGSGNVAWDEISSNTGDYPKTTTGITKVGTRLSDWYAVGQGQII